MRRARKVAATALKSTLLALVLLPVLVWAAVRPGQVLGVLMLGGLGWYMTRSQHHLVKEALDTHLPWRRWKRMRDEERYRKSFEEIVTREDWDLPASGS